jgi:hypothetical protein
MGRRSIEVLDRERKAHHVYSSRWAALRALGNLPVVISRREHPEQWQAWHSYFKAQGLTMLLDMMDNGHERTVPTWWPHDFDLDVAPHRDRRQADD